MLYSSLSCFFFENLRLPHDLKEANHKALTSSYYTVSLFTPAILYNYKECTCSRKLDEAQ